MNTLDIAIQHFGTQARMARDLGISTQAITNWKFRGRVPVEQALKIESITHGAVTLEVLRPDLKINRRRFL